MPCGHGVEGCEVADVELGVREGTAGLDDLALGEVVADDIQIESGQVMNDVAGTASEVSDDPTVWSGQLGEHFQPLSGVAVLVERVEGFASEAEWRRAYSEINDFEEQLSDRGIVLLKFWLHIDPDEQLSRFRDREATPYKKYKITDEDYRNREQWNLYAQAAHDMILHTSTDYAPWRLIPSNNKRWARIEVLRTYCQRLEDRL